MEEKLKEIKAMIDNVEQINVNNGQDGEYWYKQAYQYSDVIDSVYRMCEEALALDQPKEA